MYKTNHMRSLHCFAQEMRQVLIWDHDATEDQEDTCVSSMFRAVDKDEDVVRVRDRKHRKKKEKKSQKKDKSESTSSSSTSDSTSESESDSSSEVHASTNLFWSRSS